MKITIITSLYKSELLLNKFLERASKLHKEATIKGLEIEHILIFNSINDLEERIINKNSNTDNFKITKVPLESIYATWNRGVDLANHNNITFWNVDDIRNVNAIIEGLKNIDKYPLIYFPFIYKRYIRTMGVNILVKIKKINPPDFNNHDFTTSMQCGPFFIFTKDLYNKIGPFDESFKIAGDFDWCIRAAKYSELKKCNVVAGIFENNGVTLSGSKSEKHKNENALIYSKYGINK